MKRKITYTYRGNIERGTGRAYAWFDGYSETAADGGIMFPWMTYRECQREAADRGAVAVFESANWEQWKRDAEKLEDSELRRHAGVSTANRHSCRECFCCAAAEVLTERRKAEV